MRTIFKITGKLVKWYAKLTLWLWAVIGVSFGLKELAEQKKAGYEYNRHDATDAVFDKTVDNFKEFAKS